MRLRIYFGGASPNCGAGVRPYLIRRPALAHKNPTCFSRGSMSKGRIGNIKVYDVGNSKTARISIATNMMFETTDGAKAIETTWHDVSVWQENIKEELGSVRKGDILHVIGRVRRQRYVSANGEERYSYDVVAHSAEIVR